jgi:soluble lytic murein transglycosylase
LASLGPALGFAETHSGRVRYEIALWTVASYGIGAATRLNGTPNSAYDDRLHEWRAREAMSRRDDAAALRAIEAMPAAQRNDSRWQYFEARLRERLGQAEAARALYRKAADTATFHGFLAADRLGQPYALCPLDPSADTALRQRVASTPGVVRAIELYRVQQTSAATREWTELVKLLSDDERHVAIELAQQAHWYDRAVFTIGSRPEDLRQYKLRFPMHHEAVLRREAAKNALDAAWVAAQTRAESAFMVRARSGADARGLMQLLPGTGAMTARRLGLPWTGGDSLYVPETNIILGTAHLRHELDSWNGLPYVAIAAYNAGPAPVGRWRAARGSFDPDFWIETIPYKETREYVARVLAFSVIYDWRLDGKARPVSDRMLGRFDSAERKAFTCPAPASSPAAP